MRKLPRHLENPIESLLIDIADDITPLMHKIGMTPNMVTTYSFASQALSLVFLHKGDVWSFAALWMLGYFWDCVDGHMARKFNMASRFGDLYDHITDWVAMAGLLVVVAKRYDVRRLPAWFAAMYAALVVIIVIHTGCQQKYIHGHGETLDAAQRACPGTSSLNLTKWFSFTTTHLLMVAGIVYMEKNGYVRTP